MSGYGMRDHVASDLADGEPDHARRELAARPALARPGPPVRVPAEARLSAIDAGAAGRAASAVPRERTERESRSKARQADA